MENPRLGERVCIGGAGYYGTVVSDSTGRLAIAWDHGGIETGPIWSVTDRAAIPDPNDVDAVVAFLLQRP